MQNGGLGLDDSMSSLLNTDKRKKLGGTTSYKRPGPPTPSKNGGRLSFGGTGGSVVGRLSLGGTGYDSLSQREALKEFNDNTGNRKSITKETPGKVLGSLFSNSSKVRSEVSGLTSEMSSVCSIIYSAFLFPRTQPPRSG